MKERCPQDGSGRVGKRSSLGSRGNSSRTDWRRIEFCRERGLALSTIVDWAGKRPVLLLQTGCQALLVRVEEILFVADPICYNDPELLNWCTWASDLSPG